MNKLTLVFSHVITAICVLVASYFLFTPRNAVTLPVPILSVSSSPVSGAVQNPPDNSTVKTFIFDNYHSITDISSPFQFNYPSTIYNEGQYFSPQKIERYDLYSVKAPIYFDLVLASIFPQTELKYQIDTSKRKTPDKEGLIDGMNFKRYDLIDYGSYGGESAGHVIVYIGPQISISGIPYYLVFHWEEKPLTATIVGNDPEIFETMVHSLTFKK